ncbi:trypsin alpha-3-like [Bactrocera neohumeralis]|uniref:trypsin alpha-3-like n=1 Tax=Bactrocera neohumeralis TaxID=98809 RepID=UPI002166B565|nr:trypsin alpha-3-like [Bactrocera neohumeralis]
MAKLYISSFLLVIAACVYNTNADGAEGGVATTISAHPYIVSLQGTDGSKVCGGVLIDSKTVVTGAQCLNFYDVSQLVVGVSNGAKVVKIASSTFDIGFDFTTMQNDVAVVKLAEAVTVGTIELATKEPTNGVSGVVTTWDSSSNLVDIPVTVIDTAQCGSGKYSYSEDDILSTMLCGLATNANACGALPGSPLVSKKKLVGLVSWGYGCGNKGNPAVFTDIASLESWVKSTAKSL